MPWPDVLLSELVVSDVGDGKGQTPGYLQIHSLTIYSVELLYREPP